MEEDADAPVGFIGLGLMGSAVAANLLRTVPLLVWNRTRSAARDLEACGARVAASAAEVFETARVVFVMLSDEAALEEVILADGSVPLKDRTVVLMSTVAPSWSSAFGRRIIDTGGAYVEAPVSGSRQPALESALVSMLAGDPVALDRVEPLVRLYSSSIHRCGPVPSALTMKLAVNSFLITLVTGLAEAFHFAESNGVDLDALRSVLDAGPMASSVSRAKTAKLVAEDFAPHAAIADVLKNSLLIRDRARESGHSSPLMDVCADLYEETVALGHAAEDMAAVIRALQGRSGTADPCPRWDSNPD